MEKEPVVLPPPRRAEEAAPAAHSRRLEWAILLSLLVVAAGFPLVQAAVETFREGRPHLVNAFTRFPSKQGLHAWDQAARDKSIFADWIRTRTLQWRFDLLGEVAPKSVRGGEGWLFYNQDVDYLLQPSYTHWRFYKGTYDTLAGGKRVNLRDPRVAITDFRDRLRERGIELLMVPIPGKPSIYPEKLWPGFQGLPPSPTLDLIADLRRGGFQVVDLFDPLLRAKAADSALLYLRRDTHWTPRGMEVAAQAVAEAIRRLLPAHFDSAAAAPARYSAQPVPVNRWGDVAEMTKVPKRREIWDAEAVQARQVVDSAGAPYSDAAGSPVLWLGDSFSRIYQTDEPRGAGVIAHVALRLNHPLASVVNDGGASTVVRRQLWRKGDLLRGKKLVVWAFVERDIRFGDQGWRIEELPPDS